MNELWALFASAFLASTLLPGGSEIALVYFAKQSQFTYAVLLLVATAGNTLGGMSSWLIGRLLNVATRNQHHARAVASLTKWGPAALLFSWVPIIGDPICVAAGWLRVRWPLALVLIALGKFARYAVILALL